MSADAVVDRLRAHARGVAALLDVDPARVEQAIADAVDADYHAARAEDGWILRPDPPGPPEPAELPVEALPPALLDHVRSVADATQTPPDLAALLALATISAAAAGKARVRIDDRGWAEGLNLYAVAILPPGARKSAVFERFAAPLTEWERERGREIGPQRRAACDAVEAAKAAHARTIREGSAHEIEDARRRLDEAEAAVPRIPRILASDATPEAVVRLLAENGGRLALLAPEGDPLRVADGRYDRSGSARLDELKRAHSGDSIRVDRVGRDPLYVPRPALTLGLTMQPSVLNSLQNRGAFRGEGLLARILWLQPDPGLGSRLTGPDVPPLDVAAAARFDTVIRALLDVEVDMDADGQILARTLALDVDARAILYDFEAEIERGIGPRGELEGIADWAAKAAGQAVRIAGLLSIFGRAADRRTLWMPVGVDAMTAGVDLVRALTTHALAVLGPALDPELERFEHVLRVAAKLPAGSSMKDLFESVRGRRDLGTVDQLRAVLDDLRERGCVRLREVHSPGPGRPPSPIVEVHPQIRTIRRIHDFSESRARNGNSADAGGEVSARLTSAPEDDAGQPDSWAGEVR